MPMRMAKLYFYYASMNAGKSTTLLQADFNYRERGMETMLFTAAVHDRGGAGVIDSRIGLSAPATRSEEHTSELQSLMRISYAVFCLKKQKYYSKHPHMQYHTTQHSEHISTNKTQ